MTSSARDEMILIELIISNRECNALQKLKDFADKNTLTITCNSIYLVAIIKTFIKKYFQGNWVQFQCTKLCHFLSGVQFLQKEFAPLGANSFF